MSMPELLLLPSLRADKDASGRVRLTGKFITGVEAFQSRWAGPVRVVMEPRPGATENLDDVLVDPASLPWKIDVMRYEGDRFERLLSQAGIILGGLGHRQNGIAERASQLGVPFVTTAEYSLPTRLQIADAEARPGSVGRLRRLRRGAWERGQERANLRSVTAAAGVQANGAPTYEAYAPHNERTLLFFDTRTRGADVLADAELEARLRRVRSGEPLRLAFSGRLDPMKGVRHLPALAAALRERGVPFSLAICGEGQDAERIRTEIAEADLGDRVRMLGVLDFHRELVPFMKSEVDLFVCPHLQGDPSCTYLETLACGVPIAGFANDAWVGILDRVPAGWRAPLGDGAALAERVACAHRHRGILAERSREALAFARCHTYERAFDARVGHLRALLGATPKRAASAVSA